ncbi:aluminum-activated malate transporter 4-like [Salvia hispanica]|uniref:aluminum-activated malate transporter 4-like n=1 Tax=Salvia hispanica TaxID=49212 RepID=UPI002009242B|nr:aluminum-activated malate transporter 4-like [Salvia hispanica]
MAGNLGSLRRSFSERGRERLLSRKYYSEVESDVKHEGWLFESLWKSLKDIAVSAYAMGRSDPRKAMFAAKTGCALCLVSLLIFFNEPSNYITEHSIWAILTVVVVFEFSIGATLNKGFNRALGTFSAGALSLGIAELAKLAGLISEAVIVISIFVAGFLCSYLKQHPAVKQYEYGFRVFMLTFCIVLVSDPLEFVQTAVSRLVLIAVGAAVCLVMNVCIFPIWSGEDLHKLVVKNIKGVATSLEGCVNMYLQSVEYERIPSKILVYQASDDPLYKGYRTAVESTSQEEALLGFAIWEPPHGRYKMLNYPWSEFVKVSGALRHCAFTVMAMHGCILSEIQAPSELRQVFKEGIQRVGTEGAKVLTMLSEKVENMEKLSSEDPLADIHDAAENLQMMIDQRSYLLVNADSWDSDRRPGNLDPEMIRELKENENKPFLVKSLSSINQQSTQTLVTANNVDSGEDVFKQQTMWPSRPSLSNEREIRTYESASALSLATFTSLLIEFVARLHNLIHSFEELSEKAEFREPVETMETKTSCGFFSGVLKCLCSKTNTVQELV